MGLNTSYIFIMSTVHKSVNHFETSSNLNFLFLQLPNWVQRNSKHFKEHYWADTVRKTQEKTVFLGTVRRSQEKSGNFIEKSGILSSVQTNSLVPNRKLTYCTVLYIFGPA